ncbi:MAG: hypothetical protein Q8Q14_14335 [Gemmatimonadales bacterium]|nr:hypothetical protein [Gemmatimonadales bacterium]
MGFDETAWKQAIRDGTAPKYQYQGIAGAYHTFADALLGHRNFLDYYVQRTVDELLEEDNWPHLRHAWIKHCEEIASQQATRYDQETEGGDPEGANSRYEETLEQRVNDDHEREEWVRVRVVEQRSKLEQEIRDACDADSQDARKWREWHPPAGVYSRGLNATIPWSAVLGFCPKCREPAKDGDVWPSESYRGGYGFRCPACREGGSLDEIEARFHRPFHLIPFTTVAIRDFVKTVRPATSRPAPALVRA